MTPREKRQLIRARRLNLILFMIIIILAVFLNNIREDKIWIKYDKDLLMNSNSIKDSTIRNMSISLDTIKKSIIMVSSKFEEVKKTQTEKKKSKNSEKSKRDSTFKEKVELKVDTIKK